MREIPNEELAAEKLPPPAASWRDIGGFALTFNGYEHWGSFAACGEVAENCWQDYKAGKGLPENLTVLRTSLFFEQRRWRHYGYEPNETGMEYIQALVEGIRAKVQAGELD